MEPEGIESTPLAPSWEPELHEGTLAELLLDLQASGLESLKLLVHIAAVGAALTGLFLNHGPSDVHTPIIEVDD
jgi:hypothetical protein